MATALFVLAVVVFFAAVGRSASPSKERMPLRSWTLGDVLTNAARGLRVHASLWQPPGGTLWAEHHARQRAERQESAGE